MVAALPGCVSALVPVFLPAFLPLPPRASFLRYRFSCWDATLLLIVKVSLSIYLFVFWCLFSCLIFLPICLYTAEPAQYPPHPPTPTPTSSTPPPHPLLHPNSWVEPGSVVTTCHHYAVTSTHPSLPSTLTHKHYPPHPTLNPNPQTLPTSPHPQP